MDGTFRRRLISGGIVLMVTALTSGSFFEEHLPFLGEVKFTELQASFTFTLILLVLVYTTGAIIEVLGELYLNRIFANLAAAFEFIARVLAKASSDMQRAEAQALNITQDKYLELIVSQPFRTFCRRSLNVKVLLSSLSHALKIFGALLILPMLLTVGLLGGIFGVLLLHRLGVVAKRAKLENDGVAGSFFKNLPFEVQLGLIVPVSGEFEFAWQYLLEKCRKADITTLERRLNKSQDQLAILTSSFISIGILFYSRMFENTDLLLLIMVSAIFILMARGYVKGLGSIILDGLRLATEFGRKNGA